VGAITPSAVRLVYMGTAEFAVPTLQRLATEGFSLVTVVTQPDRPSGRGQSVKASPVKRKAMELQLNVQQPSSLKNDDIRGYFENLQMDCIVVVAYGKILPSWLIGLPKYGVMNLHGSLLPRYRGAAPIQWAMANGDSETGVCTMQIDEGLDTGPVYLCEKTAIPPEESIQELSERLSILGSDLVVRTLHGIVSETLRATPQDDSRASLAPILRKSDGYVDWQFPAQKIHNRVRAFNPWPGALTRFRGETLKILKSKVGQQIVGSAVNRSVGSIAVAKGSVTVECGDGSQLALVEVQLPARKPMSGSDFVNGMRVQSGERLEREDGQV